MAKEEKKKDGFVLYASQYESIEDLTNEQKKERIKFCERMLEMGISGKKIMFTDETKIDLSPFTRFD